ncbi:type II toxin-antitoxin system VapC family toxin [Asanoa sp. WMMD1127]|uniref:type II toxin-antitoxin system VapC family toxin n=1 Tax=Asanoa sp. WMMD1127 TaxID=3016107 RepID=UPI0024166D46|nr:type II toxin-antitoxin system VapC family toxin [Asanoa sp. WMMD1127]MDG4826758.1 type II toxin-antitoxin system VapC family toxin [Asanoa sp. WMMD1127]
MSLLLDTHVVLWSLAADPELGEEMLDRLRHDPDIYLSSVSVWEIAIKQSLGKLKGPVDLAEHACDMGFRDLPIANSHALLAGRLPAHHRDPFDRMLVAQASVEGLTLVTRDPAILRYDIATLRV